jgi:protoporphyrinogen oxidase
VLLIEKEDRVGGLCRTVEYKDFRFDLGGHRFISQDASLVEAVSTLMGKELLLVKRRSAVKLLGKEFLYPLEPLDLLRKMDCRYLLACLRDCLIFRWHSFHEAEENLEDWLTARFGPPFIICSLKDTPPNSGAYIPGVSPQTGQRPEYPSWA